MYSKELLLLSDVTILEIITHKTGIKYNIQTHITKKTKHSSYIHKIL